MLKTALDTPTATDDALFVGSPMKKQRASLAGPDAESAKARLAESAALTGNIGEIFPGSASSDPTAVSLSANSGVDNGMHHFGGAIVKKEIKDEEL